MFKERIREHYDKLTPGFRKLADFVMDHTLDVAFLTATELSRRVGVDPATVVRFAQEIGYSGFRELSAEIKRYVRDRVTASYRRVSEAESTEELLRGLVDNANQNLQYFVTTDLASVVEALEVLRGAKRIWCTGEYAGYDLAGFFAEKLSAQGLDAIAFRPSIASSSTVLARMAEGDVLLVFVNDDGSVDAGHVVLLAHDRGVRTVTITSSGVALPARHSDVTVIVPYQSPASVPSFGTLLQVTSLIYEALMISKREATATRADTLYANMTALLRMRAETPEYEVGGPQELWRDNVGQPD